MAQISRSIKVNGTTTLASSTLARAVDVETDAATLVAAHNNHDSGAASWTVLSASGASSVPLVANNAAGTQNIANLQDNGTNVLTVADGGLTTVRNTSASGKTLITNNSTSTGNIFEAQDNGVSVFSVADGGAVVATGSVTVTGVLKGAGTTTNDAAAAGVIGEYVETIVGTANVGTTAQYSDLTSILLTAGDWDVTGVCMFFRNTASWVETSIGISTTSGNSGTGLVSGSNFIGTATTSTSTVYTTQTLVIPAFRMSLSGTTTVYLKGYADYTVGNPSRVARLSARRVR